MESTVNLLATSGPDMGSQREKRVCVEGYYPRKSMNGSIHHQIVRAEDYRLRVWSSVERTHTGKVGGSELCDVVVILPGRLQSK